LSIPLHSNLHHNEYNQHIPPLKNTTTKSVGLVNIAAIFSTYKLVRGVYKYKKCRLNKGEIEITLHKKSCNCSFKTL